MREADFEAIEEAWQYNDATGLAEAGSRAGLALSLDHVHALDERSSLFDRKVIVSAIAEALANDAGIATRGAERGWIKEVLLVVRHGDRLTIGIKPVAKETVSPPGGWPELKPWFKDLAKNRARAERWASRDYEELVHVPLVLTEPRATDVDERTLIAQIVENPHDRDARLVLADRLLEREDVRGDLIRFDLELKQLAAGDPRHLELAHQIEKLVAEHGQRLAGRAGEVAEQYTLAGGFVDAITISATKFQSYGDELLRSQPIRRVKIAPYNEDAVETLAATPHLARVRSLVLASAGGRYEREVALAPLYGFRFERLEELVMESLLTLGEDGEHWFEKLDAPRLRSLHVDLGRLGSLALHGLARNALCDTLEQLAITLRARGLGERLGGRADEIADVAFTRLALPNLRVARFEGCWFSSDARYAQLVRKAPKLVVFEAEQLGPHTYEQLVRCRALERTSLDAPIPQPLFDELLALPRLHTLLVTDRIPERERQRFAERLLALPPRHPLRCVQFPGEHGRRLAKRFPKSSGFAP